MPSTLLPTPAVRAAVAPPAPPAATTIDEVLVALDAIVDRARWARCRSGYFAALYRAVTARVRDGIVAGRFEDGPRMARLDVVFANRYLAAEAAWRAGGAVPRVWAVAFDASQRWAPLVLQHLLLGMTAHIGLDLAVAAAEVAPGASLPALRRDFDEINRLLAELVDDVQARIAEVSPWMGILDWIGDRMDEALCGLVLVKARDCAWRAAERLAPLAADHAALAAEVDALDGRATLLTLPLLTPGPLARVARFGVRVGEVADPARVIEALHGGAPRAGGPRDGRAAAPARGDTRS